YDQLFEKGIHQRTSDSVDAVAGQGRGQGCPRPAGDRHLGSHPLWPPVLTFTAASSSFAAHMNVLRHTEAAFANKLRVLTMPGNLFDPAIEERTRAILQEVYARGDAALLELTERFDGAKLSAEQLPVTKAELLAASLRADK